MRGALDSVEDSVKTRKSASSHRFASDQAILASTEEDLQVKTSLSEVVERYEHKQLEKSHEDLKRKIRDECDDKW